MALDLGTIFTGITNVMAARAQPTVQVMGPTQTIPQIGRELTPALGLPFYDLVPDSPEGMPGMVWNPRANCGQGKWQKRGKRRRRRLATATDIKDLAALKAVTTGKQKEAWIATHPS